MKAGSILGIIGGIFAILIGFSFLLFQQVIVNSFFESFGYYFSPNVFAFIIQVGGILGILGGTFGKKPGGFLIMLGGILTLVGADVFGILPFIFMIVGGILTLVEDLHRSVQAQN